MEPVHQAQETPETRPFGHFKGAVPGGLTPRSRSRPVTSSSAVLLTEGSDPSHVVVYAGPVSQEGGEVGRHEGCRAPCPREVLHGVPSGVVGGYSLESGHDTAFEPASRLAGQARRSGSLIDRKWIARASLWGLRSVWSALRPMPSRSSSAARVRASSDSKQPDRSAVASIWSRFRPTELDRNQVVSVAQHGHLAAVCSTRRSRRLKVREGSIAVGRRSANSPQRATPDPRRPASPTIPTRCFCRSGLCQHHQHAPR